MPTQGTCLQRLKGPDSATLPSGAEGRGQGLEPSPTREAEGCTCPRPPAPLIAAAWLTAALSTGNTAQGGECLLLSSG